MERFRILEIENEEKYQVCGDCKHFHVHYIRYSAKHYSPLFYGHCVEPRIKKRYADARACEHWKEAMEKNK